MSDNELVKKFEPLIWESKLFSQGNSKIAFGSFVT